MGIGITVKDIIKLEIGDNLDTTLSKLKEAGLEFDIPFNKVSKKTGIQETLINMESLGIEISLENEIVTYIKSIPTKETIVMYSEDAMTLSFNDYLSRVKEFVRNHVGTDLVSIDNFDAKTYSTVISFKIPDGKIRITVMRSNRGELFLNTIRKI